MKFAELIESFCSETDGCTYYKDYSVRFMFGRKCPAIVVSQGYSYMNVLIELTAYLTSKGYRDDGFALEDTAVDALGLDSILYFPNAGE